MREPAQAESLAEDWHFVRSPLVGFYVLRADDGLYLVDTGFVGGRMALIRALAERGWAREPLRGILLTHGHLDHVFNAAALAAESGAWIAAPRLDEEHIAGSFKYRGCSRVCGVLESLGRALLRYQPSQVNRWLDDGDEISAWGGLTAIRLAGHTPGHTAYLSRSRNLLFCGDLFQSAFGRGFRPPVIFNSHPQMIPESLRRAAAMDICGVLPAHADRSTPSEHLRRLRELAERV